ncbi:hypothetical protein D3C86_1367920 [compost metagenome]
MYNAVAITAPVAVPVNVNLARTSVAVNVYHTSSLNPVALQVGAGTAEAVAEIVVPACVAVQVKAGLTVKLTAPVGSLFAGAAATAELPIQTSKVVEASVAVP